VTEHEKNSKQSRITEQSDTQIALSEYNKLRNHDNETGLTGTGTNYLPTQDQSENIYRNNDEYKIPVRIQRTTEDIKSTNDDFFVEVSRKRSARFSLSGIDSKSTRTGILRYLELKVVKAMFLQLFHGRYSSSRLSAKLNIKDESAEIIESENFWPECVQCSRWLSNRDWYNRRNDKSAENN
jgi:hypothetical protein